MQNTNDLRNIIGTISTKLYKNDIVAEIHYRLKDPCSALKKILRRFCRIYKSYYIKIVKTKVLDIMMPLT